jgi:hypothetical protein
MGLKKFWILAFVAASAALVLLGDENLNPPTKVTDTKRLDFAPGGVLRVNGSRGDLYVEGWDQRAVELQVSKFMPFEYAPDNPSGPRND